MYGGYGYYGLGYSLFDPTMILVYIGALLSLWASHSEQYIPKIIPACAA